MMTHAADYYEVLGVARDATTEAIKKQFRGLALVTHPDKNPHDVKAATVRFQLLQRAAETLSDPDKRAKYDATLRGKRPHRAGQAQESRAEPSSFSSSSSSSSSSSRKFSFSSPSQSFTFKYKSTGAEEVSAKEKSGRKRRRQRQKRKDQRQ